MMVTALKHTVRELKPAAVISKSLRQIKLRRHANLHLTQHQDPVGNWPDIG